MKLGISYWSKGEQEEFAVHEFADNGDVTGFAQFGRTGEKYGFAGDKGLLMRGAMKMKDVEAHARFAIGMDIFEKNAKSTDQPAGSADRA